MEELNLTNVFDSLLVKLAEVQPVAEQPVAEQPVAEQPVAEQPVIDPRPTQEVGCRIEAALGKPKSKKKPQPQTRQLAPWQKLPVEKSPKKSKAKPKKSKANQSRAKRGKPM